MLFANLPSLLFLCCNFIHKLLRPCFFPPTLTRQTFQGVKWHYTTHQVQSTTNSSYVFFTIWQKLPYLCFPLFMLRVLSFCHLSSFITQTCTGFQQNIKLNIWKYIEASDYSGRFMKCSWTPEKLRLTDFPFHFDKSLVPTLIYHHTPQHRMCPCLFTLRHHRIISAQARLSSSSATTLGSCPASI